MSLDDFIAKRQGVALTARVSAQKHFIDLCRLLGEQTPTEADSTGTRCAVEKGVRSPAAVEPTDRPKRRWASAQALHTRIILPPRRCCHTCAASPVPAAPP